MEQFHEPIKIGIQKEGEGDDFSDDKYLVSIKDEARGLNRARGIRGYFNEAKCNLILLLLWLNAVKCAKESTKKNVIILDDFITSLDIANRTLLMRYIFDHFSLYKMVILTHNVYLYNLSIYLIHDIYYKESSWRFANLYTIDGESKIYFKGKNELAKAIKKDYKDSLSHSELISIGNRIRQRFEILLYELSKLIMIGAVEEGKEILDRLLNQKNLYFNQKKLASDLVDEISHIVNLESPQNLQNSIKSKISKYKYSDYNNLTTILKLLKVYKKVTLHPMSHGTSGQTPFTQKEVKISLELLEKLEKSVKGLINSQVV